MTPILSSPRSLLHQLGIGFTASGACHLRSSNDTSRGLSSGKWVSALWASAFFVFVLLPENGFSRVFRFEEKSFGAYFGGSYFYLPSSVSAIENTSGSQTVVSAPLQNGYGAEFGFMLSRSAGQLRFGLELLYPKKITQLSATDSLGNELMSINSQLLIWGPTAALEIFLIKESEFRLIFSFGAGLSQARVLTEYTLTAQGLATYPGVVNYTEEATSSTVSTFGALGTEFLFVDNVAALFSLGYRYMNFTSFNHARSGTALTGTAESGSSALTNAGDARSMNFSHAYANLLFRFYF
ncbi:MAG: hypothetical protein COT74_07035 [Bdellovibrionales bacterium CG10_big_fil_rev_8_21_14_0_10_45_34]|nr:MAG: hypothetical protein COT74_07035 [Bdellovibrionales bacterium CG10_big_fil_rev_8_21_14_0_10_45_34]